MSVWGVIFCLSDGDGDKRSVYPLENKHFTHKRGGKHVEGCVGDDDVDGDEGLDVSKANIAKLNSNFNFNYNLSWD